MWCSSRAGVGVSDVACTGGTELSVVAKSSPGWADCETCKST